MAKQAGKALRRAIDLQQAFGDMTGAAPVVPQAGLAVTQSFLDQSGDALPAIQSVIEKATAEVVGDPKGASLELASQNLGDAGPASGGVDSQFEPCGAVCFRSARRCGADAECHGRTGFQESRRENAG